MPKRIFALAIILLMVASGLTVLASSGWTPQGISDREEVYKARILDASGDHYWIGTTTDTSVAANWQPAEVPAAGDNIYFSALSVGPCTWGLTGSYGSFNLLANNTRTITQAASFSVTSFLQEAGTFTGGSASYTLTVSGAFAKPTGTLTAYTLNLIAGTSFTWGANSGLYSLTCSGSTTISAITTTQRFTNSGTLSINNGVTVLVDYRSGYTFSNTGTVTGLGTWAIDIYDGSYSFAFGTINSPARLYLHGSSAASRTITLTAAGTFGSTLLVDSAHASNTLTLDLSASNYALSCTDLTIGTRGILNGRGSQITASGLFDSSAGSFIPGTSSLHLTGTSKTLKTDGTSGFNKLFVEAGASYTLASNIHTTNFWKNGTLALGGKVLYVNNNQAPVFTSTPPVTTFASGSAYSYDANATDREGTTLTYGLTTNLSGLVINSTTGVVSRGATHHARGTFLMHVSVTDGNHTTWQNTTLTLTNVNPVFTSTPITSKAFDQSYSYDANATDTEGATITYGLSSTLPSLVVNSTTGVVSKSLYLGNGTFTVSVSASDGNHTVWQNFSFATINLYPVVTSRPGVQVVIHESYSYLPAGTDPEGLTIIVNVSFSASWLTLNPNGTISGSPLTRDVGSWLVNVSFWDGYRTTYDNYTIEVAALDSSTTAILTLAMGLIFSFAFLFLGIRNPIFMMIAGIIWTLVSISIFSSYDPKPLFMMVGVGVGIIALFDGGFRQWS